MDEDEDAPIQLTRRAVLETGTAIGLAQDALASDSPDFETPPAPMTAELRVNGQSHSLKLDARTTHP
jgi:hypothetical protein